MRVISVFEDRGDVFVYQTASPIVYEVFPTHEAASWDQLATAIQFPRANGQPHRVHRSVIKFAYRYSELLERLGMAQPIAVWDGKKIELKHEPGPAAKAFLSTMLPAPQPQRNLMRFKVSIEVPGTPSQPF